jgi:hypothetical protein
MLITIIIVVALALLGYVLRRNFRRSWHVLRTGDEHPDWEKLGADHYLADWEIRFWKLSAGKKEAETTNVSE